MLQNNKVLALLNHSVASCAATPSIRFGFGSVGQSWEHLAKQAYLSSLLQSNFITVAKSLLLVEVLPGT